MACRAGRDEAGAKQDQPVSGYPVPAVPAAHTLNVKRRPALRPPNPPPTSLEAQRGRRSRRRARQSVRHQETLFHTPFEALNRVDQLQKSPGAELEGEAPAEPRQQTEPACLRGNKQSRPVLRPVFRAGDGPALPRLGAPCGCPMASAVGDALIQLRAHSVAVVAVLSEQLAAIEPSDFKPRLWPSPPVAATKSVFGARTSHWPL